MKKFFKPFFLILLIAFVAIQFYRPAKNRASGVSINDIVLHYKVPKDVHDILQKSCYDCHSNNTVYPWYAEVQPIGWWLNDHIVDGKKDLNFSEFASYRIRRQYRKLEEISELVKDNSMPLSSYTRLHKNAILKDEEKNILYAWVEATRDSIAANNPPDSLIKR